MTEPHHKLQVKIARGNIYIPFETCEIYLKNIEAVALLPHEKGILIFPLIQQSAGGLLLKIKNLQGDRVVHAQEFFRNNGYAETFDEIFCDTVWESERHAILVEMSQQSAAL
jgi:hypothetical protein